MKKIQPILFLPLILIVISISLFDFDNPGFDENILSYLGGGFAILFFLFYYLKLKNKQA